MAKTRPRSKAATPRKKAPTARAKPSAARLGPEVTHRHVDMAAIGLLALAALCVVGLVSSNSGAFGGAVRTGFGLLFGKGAWVAPLALIVVALGLLRGKKASAPTWSTGIGLVFLALLGSLAGPKGGDWFDPVAISDGGGYFGTLLGWGLDSAFGAGRGIALLAIALVGIVLTLDRPLREYIAAFRDRPDASVPPLREEKPPKEKSRAKGFSDTEETSKETDIMPKRKVEPVIRDHADVRPTPKKEVAPSKSLEDGEEPAPPKEGYVLPTIDVLATPPPATKRSPEEVQKHIGTIEGTLGQFGIEADVVEVATGPTVTRYEIQLGPGIRVARIVSLADNIAMDMAASQVRVEAPIPGKSAIGLEIPNSAPAMVSIRELAEAPEFIEAKSRLLIALGKDVAGVNRYADLTKMPHLLIAGATNSGKSIGLATLITSLLMRNTPREVRLVMIDPKRVELTLFDRIPHLMCPVIKDVKDAPGVFRAIIREMDRRYDLLSGGSVRNIEGWNERASFNEKLPYIVVVVDELADLMVQAKAEVETSIVRIAQLARAVGIHLVIATQRPSVDVITGTIKANIPSRVAFSVASQIDSRTILDTKGAEALIGKGDMLYAPIDATKPLRIQGCYVSEGEIEAICAHWRGQEGPTYTIDPAEFRAAEEGAGGSERAGDDELDPLWQESVTYAVERGQISTSDIQRRFKIGFQRASRLLDQMEGRGIVGARDGPRPREVLISSGELDTIFGGGPEYDMGTSIDDL